MDWEILKQDKFKGFLIKHTYLPIEPFWVKNNPNINVQIPSVPTRLINVTKAVGRFLKSSLKNRKLQFISAEDYKIRLELCNTCTSRTDDNKCKVCGCKIVSPILGKAQLLTEQCPLGKWPILVVSSQPPEIYEPNNIQGHKTG